MNGIVMAGVMIAAVVFAIFNRDKFPWLEDFLCEFFKMKRLSNPDKECPEPITNKPTNPRFDPGQEQIDPQYVNNSRETIRVDPKQFPVTDVITGFEYPASLRIEGITGVNTPFPTDVMGNKLDTLDKLNCNPKQMLNWLYVAGKRGKQYIDHSTFYQFTPVGYSIFDLMNNLRNVKVIPNIANFYGVNAHVTQFLNKEVHDRPLFEQLRRDGFMQANWLNFITPYSMSSPVTIAALNKLSVDVYNEFFAYLLSCYCAINWCNSFLDILEGITSRHFARTNFMERYPLSMGVSYSSDRATTFALFKKYRGALPIGPWQIAARLFLARYMYALIFPNNSNHFYLFLQQGANEPKRSPNVPEQYYNAINSDRMFGEDTIFKKSKLLEQRISTFFNQYYGFKHLYVDKILFPIFERNLGFYTDNFDLRRRYLPHWTLESVTMQPGQQPTSQQQVAPQVKAPFWGK